MGRHARAARPRRRWRAGAAAVLALTALGCGAGADDTTGAGASDDQPQRTGSAESSPFTIGPPPEGYKLVMAGLGNIPPVWGDDSSGNDSPYTVLAPGGDTAGADVVLVSITGFEGYQSGLSQAGSFTTGDREEFTVDDHEALYHPGTVDDGTEYWADLVAVRGDDLAVRVTTPDATREELVDILERVEVGPDRTHAPVVADPPDGLQVVGSVDVDGIIARQDHVYANSEAVAGPASAHSAGWIAGGSEDERHLLVHTLSGRSIDLDAVPFIYRDRYRDENIDSHDRDVAGQRARAFEWTERSGDFHGRSIWAESTWGDIIVVTGYGRSPPSEDELVAFAASVQRTDDVAWEAFVTEAVGGPDLRPDEGRSELARGQAGGVEWLLQNGPPWSVRLNDPNIAPGSLRALDPCLKLSDRRRACVDIQGGGTTDDWIRSTARTEKFPAFAMVSTTGEGASLRATTAMAEATVPLVAVPGGGLWGAVIVIEGAGPATCKEGDDLLKGLMRIDLLDAQGTVIGCLGPGA